MPIDARATIAAMTTIGVRVNKGTEKGVEQGLRGIQLLARKNVTKVTGELAESIYIFGPRPGRSADTWIGTVQPTVVYGRIHELGGRIYPHKRALAFFWPGHSVEPTLKDGRVLIRTYVYQRPQPYLKPAMEEAKPIIRRFMKVEWANSLRFIGG